MISKSVLLAILAVTLSSAVPFAPCSNAHQNIEIASVVMDNSLFRAEGRSKVMIPAYSVVRLTCIGMRTSTWKRSTATLHSGLEPGAIQLPSLSMLCDIHDGDTYSLTQEVVDPNGFEHSCIAMTLP